MNTETASKTYIYERVPFIELCAYDRSSVRWNGEFSRAFTVRSGVRQGGVLNLHLFAIYVDDLIANLRRLKVGCTLVETGNSEEYTLFLNIYYACFWQRRALQSDCSDCKKLQ